MNSTWREESLFGLDPLLVSRLLTELPYDEFRVALVLHPNVWASHSKLQIESWLSAAPRAGLILLPPEEGWRAAVIASDWVLSDHGSVSIYAAAIGRPVLLEKSGRSVIDPQCGLGRLFEVAAPLDPLAAIRPQLSVAERRLEDTHTVARAWVSSAPEHSLRLIREEAYRIIGVPPSATEPVLAAVESPKIDGAAPFAMWTHVERVDDGGPGEFRVRRTPAAVTGVSPSAVLIVSDRELDHRLSGMADIIRISAAELPSDEDAWSATIFRHRPGVRLTVVQDGRSARMRARDGGSVSLVLDSISHPDDAELVFAVLAERILTGTDVAMLNPLTVRVSPERTIRAEFRQCR